MARVIWTRASRYRSVSDEGYTIAAIGMADGWLFSAWAPPDPEWRQRSRMSYARGEHAPQPCECLGTYDDVEKAKAACAAHQETLYTDDANEG
ncbi:MAG: hypothetical protein U5L11_02680 [Arhodomonas sp.]|nr:hypothetical protein [Arhodomonas sp.]